MAKPSPGVMLRGMAKPSSGSRANVDDAWKYSCLLTIDLCVQISNGSFFLLTLPERLLTYRDFSPD